MSSAYRERSLTYESESQIIKSISKDITHRIIYLMRLRNTQSPQNVN